MKNKFMIAWVLAGFTYILTAYNVYASSVSDDTVAEHKGQTWHVTCGKEGINLEDIATKGGGYYSPAFVRALTDARDDNYAISFNLKGNPQGIQQFSVHRVIYESKLEGELHPSYIYREGMRLLFGHFLSIVFEDKSSMDKFLQEVRPLISFFGQYKDFGKKVIEKEFNAECTLFGLPLGENDIREFLQPSKILVEGTFDDRVPKVKLPNEQQFLIGRVRDVIIHAKLAPKGQTDDPHVHLYLDNLALYAKLSPKLVEFLKVFFPGTPFKLECGHRKSAIDRLVAGLSEKKG